MSEFIKYGKFDTIEHARNGTDSEEIAQARVNLYNVHQKAKREINGQSENNSGRARKTRK